MLLPFSKMKIITWMKKTMKTNKMKMKMKKKTKSEEDEGCALLVSDCYRRVLLKVLRRVKEAVGFWGQSKNLPTRFGFLQTHLLPLNEIQDEGWRF